MDYTLTQFEKGKTLWKGHPVLSEMFNMGWGKMEKYYKLTDNSPAYAASMILDPRGKWTYIERNWKSVWLDPAKKLVQTQWDKEYRPTIPDDLYELLCSSLKPKRD